MGKKGRSRRETEGIEEEDKALNETISESLNLFQAIHVLQSNEDEADYYRNQTNAGTFKYIEMASKNQYKCTNRRHSFNFIFSEPLFDDIDSVCVGSVVFAGVIGSLAFVALLSSVIVSLLCLKMRRLKDTEASVDSLNAKEHVRPRPSTTFIPG